MASYFLVEQVAGPAWDPNRPRREQAGWAAHAAFMDQLVEEGFIVLGGPVGEDDGDYALLMVEADDLPSVHVRMAPDPWDGTVLISRSIKPWQLWLRRPDALSAPPTSA